MTSFLNNIWFKNYYLLKCSVPKLADIFWVGPGQNCTTTKMHEVSKLHEGSKMHGAKIARVHKTARRQKCTKTKMHEGSKLHEGSKMHEDYFAQRVKIARLSVLHGGSKLHDCQNCTEGHNCTETTLHKILLILNI